jgi:hypothetical protein
VAENISMTCGERQPGSGTFVQWLIVPVSFCHVPLTPLSLGAPLQRSQERVDGPLFLQQLKHSHFTHFPMHPMPSSDSEVCERCWGLFTGAAVSPAQPPSPLLVHRWR